MTKGVLLLVFVFGCKIFAMESVSFEDFFGISEKILDLDSTSKEGYWEIEKEYYVPKLLPNNWLNSTIVTDRSVDALETLIATNDPKGAVSEKDAVNETVAWIKRKARKSFVTRILIEKAIEKLSLDKIHFPDIFVFFTEDKEDGTSSLVQITKKSDIKDSYVCNIIQKHIPHDPKMKMTKDQAEQMLTLLRYVYLDLGSCRTETNNLHLCKDGLYIIDTEDKKEHFVKNWPKFWRPNYPFDQEATEFINGQKKNTVEKLKKYLCEYREKHKGNIEDIEDFSKILPSFDKEPVRKSAVNSIRKSDLKNLFEN